VPVVGPVRTPALAVSQARVAPPRVALRAGGGEVGAAASAAAVETPDLQASAAEAGPLRVSRTELDVPDVEASAARVAVSTDAPPEVDLPGVAASGMEVTTPDVDLGPAQVELPDVTLPDVELPDVSLGGDRPDRDGAAVDED
jgi:hypothetical protein